MVKANCRGQFTLKDLSFVAQALTKSPSESEALLSLLADEKERDFILDHDVIYHQLLDNVGILQVSPAFYFYILTRRVLKRAGVEERALSDYVAAVLTAFSRVNQLEQAPISNGQPSRHFTYISDMLAALANADANQIFALQSHIGNYTLFLTGIFAERVKHQAERRGAPAIGFYEAIGQSSYRTAANYPEAKKEQLRPIYEQLAVEFHAIRVALNELAENLIHLNDAPPPLEI